jgi:porin
MNGSPRDFADDSKHGVGIGFDPDEGAFFIAEVTYQWSTSSSQRRARPGRKPGRVILGGYYDTGTFDALDGSGDTASGIWNLYGIGRQRVWEPHPGSKRGIDVWTAVTCGGKEEIAPIRTYWSGGAVWSGPFAARESDSLAFGFGTSYFSPALEEQSSETTIELAYSFAVNEALSVTPDIQYLIRPGGTGEVDDALVLGVLLYVTF